MGTHNDKTWTKGSRREESPFILEIGRRKTQVKLTFGKVILGRHPKLCNIIFTHPLISRQHCGVLVTLDQITLQDFKSRNGTLVNGKKIDHCVLAPNDVIKIGGVEIRVVFNVANSAKPESAVKVKATDKTEALLSLKPPLLKQTGSTADTLASETHALDDELLFDPFNGDLSQELPDDILNRMFELEDD